jgi:hypothetical protein
LQHSRPRAAVAGGAKEIRADLTLLEWADEDAVWPPASSRSSQQHRTPVHLPDHLREDNEYNRYIRNAM